MISKYMKDYFFFKVSKEEKEAIRMKIMESDHKSFNRALFIIAMLQSVMVCFNLFSYGFSPTYFKHIAYRICYLALIFICMVLYLVIRPIYEKKKTFPYFLVVSIAMDLILMWSICISVLGSSSTNDIITFAYVAISISVFIILDPWISSINIIISTIILNILLATHSFTKDTYDTGVLINSLSVAALAILCSCVNFRRRIDSVRLEIQVRKLNVSLENKASTDDLTGIYNRRFLTQHITSPLNIGQSPTGLLLFDIDHFKQVNDTYGHVNGDKVLEFLGKEIRELVKTIDGAYAVRYGGEEFLVYIPNIKKDALYELGESFRKQIESSSVKLIDDSTLNFTISIGLASAKIGQTYSTLISCSDEALYRAKETRNTVCF